MQLNHNWIDQWQGIVGVHIQNDSTTPVGAEANSPATKNRCNRDILLHNAGQIGAAQWHLGARIEQVEIKPTLTQANALSSIDFTPVSWAAGVDWGGD